jgi:exodeoxyribonuclease VII small subunit
MAYNSAVNLVMKCSKGHGMSKRQTEAPPEFEQALTELEKIVDSMENQSLPLDQSVAAYQRGAELIKICQQHLAQAKEKLQMVDEHGELKSVDWDN